MLKVLLSLIIVSISLAQTKIRIQVTGKDGNLKNKRIQILCAIGRNNKPSAFLKRGQMYLEASRLQRKLQRNLKRASGARSVSLYNELQRARQISKIGAKTCRTSRSLFTIASSSFQIKDTVATEIDLTALNPGLPAQTVFEFESSLEYVSQVGSTLVVSPNFSSESGTIKYRARLANLSSNQGTLYLEVVRGEEFAGEYGSLVAYRDEITEREARHMLNKIGFGGDSSLVDRIVQVGLERGTKDLISDCMPTDDEFKSIDARAREIESPLKSRAWTNVNGVDYYSDDYPVSTALSKRSYLIHHFRHGSPLCGAMFTFLYNHFSGNLSDYLENMHQSRAADDYVDLLMTHAVGRFDKLVSKMHSDNFMNRWLNNASNTALEPNENYGRELLELFTLGVINPVTLARNYEESDVRPMTRALAGFERRDQLLTVTGYSAQGGSTQIKIWPRGIRFDLNRWMQNPSSPEEITIFKGKPYQLTAPFIANSWVNVGTDFNHDTITPALLYNHPGAPVYLSAKLLGRFIGPDVPESMISELAGVVLSNGYDLSVILEILLRSESMFSSDARLNSVKSPIEHLMTTVRSLDLPVLNSRANGNNRNNDLYKLIAERSAIGGQNLLFYPSVFGVLERGVIRNGRILDGSNWINAFGVLMRERAVTAYLNELQLYIEHGDYSWRELLSRIPNPENPENVASYIAKVLNIDLTQGELDNIVQFMTSVKLGATESPSPYEWKVHDLGYVNIKMPTIILMMAMMREANLA